jgi:hypothetical protein
MTIATDPASDGVVQHQVAHDGSGQVTACIGHDNVARLG